MLSDLSASQLLRLQAELSAELRRRGICRSSNNPVADYAEGIVAKALNLQLASGSTTGFDAVDSEGRRYEIKARRETSSAAATMLSAIRGLEKRHFDFLVVVLFNEDYSVRKAIRLRYETVRRLARFRKHVNGHIIMIRDLWTAEGSEDLTMKLAEDGSIVRRPLRIERSEDERRNAMKLAPMSEYEQEQVRLRDRELTLKERELTLERRKNWVTVATVIVSVAAVLLTYWGTRQGQLEQTRVQTELQEKAARDAFELKAAEIAMSGRGSFDAKGRAKALAALFPGRLPEFGSAFDPVENSWGRDSKSELLALLQQRPPANIGGQSSGRTRHSSQRTMLSSAFRLISRLRDTGMRPNTALQPTSRVRRVETNRGNIPTLLAAERER